MEKFMTAALVEANKAYNKNEMPVGAVIVCDGNIIACAHNTKEKTKKPTDHAEIKAILKACEVKKDWRLDDCLLFVNLEPCLMCYGLILETRIKKVYCSLKNNNNSEHLSKLVKSNCCITEYGLLEEESKELLSKFFEKIRNSK